jgi:hypothetical protein
MMALMQSWSTAMLARRGVDLQDGARIGEALRAAGIANVATQRVDIPLGSYGGRIGTMMATDLLSGAAGLGGLVVQMGLATDEQFAQTMAGLREELSSPDNRAVFPFYIAFGQRAG